MTKLILVWIGLAAIAQADTVDARLQALEAQVTKLSGELQTLRAEYNRLRGIRGVADRIQYPANDQHDTLKMNLLELAGDAETNRIDQVADRKRLEQLTQASENGAVPGKSVAAAALQVSLDTFDQKAIAFHQAAINTKLQSLEFLNAGRVLDFAQMDRETNFQQLQWYDYEVQKAQATAAYTDEQYQQIHGAYLSHAAPWATDHTAKQDRDRAAAAVRMWQSKRTEQQHQFDTADAVWRDLKAHPEQATRS